MKLTFYIPIYCIYFLPLDIIPSASCEQRSPQGYLHINQIFPCFKTKMNHYPITILFLSSRPSFLFPFWLFLSLEKIYYALKFFMYILQHKLLPIVYIVYYNFVLQFYVQLYLSNCLPSPQAIRKPILHFCYHLIFVRANKTTAR